VEYVRVCTAYGAGFFYIPGTDTCLRVTGFAQAAYQYTASLAPRPDVSGFRSMGRIALDARTDTAYGTLRTFIRMDMRNGSGSYLHSGTAVRYATAFTGTGVDTVGRLQTYVELDKAFIQFAGFTAGRAASFFDFYAAAHEIIGASYGSNVSATNLFAYTATFGGGLSATISVEDPTWRRQPVFNAFGFGGAGTAASQGFGGLTAQFSNPASGSLRPPRLRRSSTRQAPRWHTSCWTSPSVTVCRTSSATSASTSPGARPSSRLPLTRFSWVLTRAACSRAALSPQVSPVPGIPGAVTGAG
jgi:hypothetical protein